MRYRRRLVALALSVAMFWPVIGRAQHVVGKSGDNIVISSGSNAGVTEGITGKICLAVTVGGQRLENCSALFEIVSVSKQTSKARITKGARNVANGAIVKFDHPPVAPPLLDQPTKLLQSADRLFDDEAFRDALILYERFLRDYANRDKAKYAANRVKECREKILSIDAIALLRAADLAFEARDCRGALERYEKFLQLFPTHPKIDYVIDRANRCRSIITPPPDPPVALLNEADLAFSNGDYRGALDRYENFLRGYSHHNKADYAADRANQCRTKIALTQADKLVTMAEGLFQAGKLGEARAAALEALRIDSTNSRARTTLRAVQVKLVQSRFSGPTDVAVIDGACYVADAGNNTIRMIKANASTTVAGSAGQDGFTDGPSARARFNEPNGVAVAQDRTVYVSDRYNAIIRKIAPDGTVTTVAGRSGLTGNADGTAAAARFNGPRRITVAADGTIYVADTGNHAVRRILPAGTIETVVTSSGTDRMDPIGLAIDGDGNILVADAWSHVIRKIDRSGRLSIVAGVLASSGSNDGPIGSARFSAPEGVAVDTSGAIYVADTANHTIRKIVNGVVTTVAGRAELSGAIDGSGPVARLNHPSGIRCDAQGRLWIADSGNNAVRLMTDRFVETMAGLPGAVGSSDGAN